MSWLSYILNAIPWLLTGYQVRMIHVNIRQIRRDRRNEVREVELLAKIRPPGSWLERDEFYELVKIWPGYARFYFTVRPPWATPSKEGSATN